MAAAYINADALREVVPRPTHRGVYNTLHAMSWPSVGTANALAAMASDLWPEAWLQLGMAVNWKEGPRVSKHAAQRPRLTRLLAPYARRYMPRFAFWSLAVACSSEATAHEGPNANATTVVALGPQI